MINKCDFHLWKVIFVFDGYKLDSFHLFLTRPSKGGHSKKKGPRTPSPPPVVPLDLPVPAKKHKGKHKNKEKSEEKHKEGKDRGRDAEKHKEKKEKRRYSMEPAWVNFTSIVIIMLSYSRVTLWDSFVVYRDRSDSSHKAKRSITSEERSGSVSSPSRGASPTGRKKSISPRAPSHKASALASPPRRFGHMLLLEAKVTAEVLGDS